jgi:hypothetical protein
MTSIAAYVLQAKGAYRMPNAHLFSFAIFDEVGWAGAGAGSPWAELAMEGPAPGGDFVAGRVAESRLHQPAAGWVTAEPVF